MPDTTVIHMYGAGSGGSESAIANIDIPEDGTITGVEWGVNADLDADGENLQGELSFIATTQYSTNDSRGVISSVSAQMSLTTSGVALVSINKFTPMELFVAGGERLYLHVVATAGVVSALIANVHFQPLGGVRRRSQRRRG